ncbi:hypothetical protein LUW76_30905 [Actinomadura madurae]|uniref:hypothetical protein n=1 Tax=Actinomadura madurae TaxID=1993 RepID=UPI002026D63B|nr:hypothetical protein [Actinomadura madurae]URM98401.1 hypothetical protein LUW76_30905 [Actinomadura madurae]
METRAHIDDPALRQLREEFTGHRIWRSRRWDGLPGDWVATLRDPAAGVDPTVVCSDPAALREALMQERERADRRGVERAW